MENRFSIIASKKHTLQNHLSCKDFDSSFDIFYAETPEEIISLIEKRIPTLIVLSEDFIFPDNKDIIAKSHEKAMMINALNNKVSIKVPVIGIMKKIDFAVQKEFYNCGAFECFPESTPPENLYAILLHMAESISKNQEHITNFNEQQQNTIKQLVQIDNKTGIYNKDTFIFKTKKLLKINPEKKYFLILMNLDRFKVFNDLFGFAAGDEILAQIGRILRNKISKNSLYGHIYADHFVVCTQAIPEENLNSLFEKADIFIKALHPKFEFMSRYGIYEINDSYEDISLAIDRAELALSSIKHDYTKLYTFYNDSMIKNLKDEQELITDMIVGLEKDEFTVYLQPQYDYTTESLVGAEALVRWQHPTKGLISPGLFIPVFERNGFITQLDLRIWEKTCKLLQKWKEANLNPVPVSVNISRRDIYSQNLVEVFKSLLAKYNLTPDLLRLEITESAYMDNPSQLIQVVEDLRSAGFCVEMDDFGSGYSSLNTLKEVPVDILKLDMKFIASDTEDFKDGKNNSKGGSILSSVVRMANWLNLPIIAEGIESKEQADYLKSIGCFHMQGFYFAKPLPIEQYEDLLSNLKPASTTELTTSENSESTKFLDVSTQATLIFNNFVGGAAIIEWNGECVEALRVNDQFYEELGINSRDFERFKKNIIPTIEEHSQSILFSTMSEITKLKKTAFCEIKIKPFYNGMQPFWIRVNLRHLGKTITSNIFYAAIQNIDFRMQLLQVNTNLSEKLTNLIENIPCGILLLSFGKTVKVSYSNNTTSKILEYKQFEMRKILDANPLGIFANDEQDFIKQSIYNAAKSEQKSFAQNATVICKGGTTKKIQLCGNVFEQTDGTISANILIIDTAGKKIEQEN